MNQSLETVAPIEVGILVEDLPRMQEFYESVVDLEWKSTFDVSADRAAQAGMCPGGYRIVRLQARTGERIKLIQANGGIDALDPERWVLARSGLVFITLIVADIDAAIERVRQTGMAFDSGLEKLEIRPGAFLSFFRDPEGNRLELVEYADLAGYRPDVVSPTNL